MIPRDCSVLELIHDAVGVSFTMQHIIVDLLSGQPHHVLIHNFALPLSVLGYCLASRAYQNRVLTWDARNTA